MNGTATEAAYYLGEAAVVLLPEEVAERDSQDSAGRLAECSSCARRSGFDVDDECGLCAGGLQRSLRATYSVGAKHTFVLDQERVDPDRVQTIPAST
jgi:hypothetical protein